ncbi:trypsin-like cysteine/serine peptidase domain-containing protein [Immersiella caudata]|uniref:Trypsin-like cysteine/serine peptidase domain-containing protein n=1 Tax=Immersiella caudata TaxID=314043 RepID=A0AA39WZC6_9PEZI|nr:trypsin-like cysteine/serine peptidase domain-containing protein [Immersiella caudata]
MKLPLLTAITSLLALSAPATSFPLSWTDIFNFAPPVCLPPPTPKTTRLTAADLTKFIKPFMPPPRGGISFIPSFRPPLLNFTRKSFTTLFTDPHLKQFLTIAPNSSMVLMRKQVRDDTRMSYPYTTFGKVFLRDGAKRGFCSGTMVGPNLLLTANHCIAWKSTGNWSVEFVPGFNAEDSRQPRPWGGAFAKQCLGVDAGPTDGRDYAVCELDAPIGLSTGYLGWKASLKNEFYLKGEWNSVGYPFNFRGGQVPATEEGIRMRKVESSGGEGGKIMASSPYVEQGWSGGAVFGWEGDEPFVAGVVTATVGTSALDHIFAEFTFHAGGVRLAEMVQFGLTQWSLLG